MSGVTPGHQQCHHSIEHYDFLFIFRTNYASILSRFRDIASYLSKVANFSTPRVFLAPVEGAAIGLVSRSLVSESSAVVSSCLYDDMFSRFKRTTACDGQTDGQTDVQTQGRIVAH